MVKFCSVFRGWAQARTLTRRTLLPFKRKDAKTQRRGDWLRAERRASRARIVALAALFNFDSFYLRFAPLRLCVFAFITLFQPVAGTAK